MLNSISMGPTRKVEKEKLATGCTTPQAVADGQASTSGHHFLGGNLVMEKAPVSSSRYRVQHYHDQYFQETPQYKANTDSWSPSEALVCPRPTPLRLSVVKWKWSNSCSDFLIGCFEDQRAWMRKHLLRNPEGEISLCHLPAVWPWINDSLISLKLAWLRQGV